MHQADENREGMKCDSSIRKSRITVKTMRHEEERHVLVQRNLGQGGGGPQTRER